MSFGQPLLLLLLIALLPVVAAWIWLGLWRRAAARRLAGTSARRISRWRRPVKMALVLCGLALVAVAAAGPRRGERRVLLPRQGADVIIGLDVSASMLATDVAPNRFDQAKLMLNNLLDRLQGDRVGLVVFAGNAGLRFPLTTDIEVAKDLINSSAIKEGGLSAGTGIGDAIRLAVSTYPEGEEGARSKVLVLVTDGEDIAGGPEDAVRQARDRGIIVHTVGIGTQEGGAIVLPTPARGGGGAGNTTPATSRRDEGLLRLLADTGRGRYFDAATGDVAAGVADAIGRLERTNFESQEGTIPIERFQPFVIAALALLALDLLIGESAGRLRRTRVKPPRKPARAVAPSKAPAPAASERAVATERATSPRTAESR